MPLQTYKTNTNATGARCEANDTTKSKLLLAGIVLAGVVLLALLFAAIMFYRYGRPTHVRTEMLCLINGWHFDSRFVVWSFPHSLCIQKAACQAIELP